MRSGAILVTGATGNVGREVVAQLAARGTPVRAAVRNPAEARGLPPGVDAVALDFEAPETFEPALQGVKGVFLLRPPQISRVEGTLNRLVDEAVRLGVDHVVFLSVAGAEKNRFVPHHGVEQRLLRADIGWTILRPGFFAQNLGDQYRRDINEDDRVHVCAGRGKVAFVDVRDVAELAALAFHHPDLHRGQAWTLTGPEAVSFDDVAQRLSEALRRRIRYQPASIPGQLFHLRRRRRHAWAQAAVITILHAGIRFGQAEQVDPTLERLLGRSPRTVGDYIRDHVALWNPTQPEAG